MKILKHPDIYTQTHTQFQSVYTVKVVSVIYHYFFKVPYTTTSVLIYRKVKREGCRKRKESREERRKKRETKKENQTKIMLNEKNAKNWRRNKPLEIKSIKGS